MSQKSDEKRRIFMGLAERKKLMPKGIREKISLERKNKTNLKEKRWVRAFRF